MSEILNTRNQGAALYQAERRGCYDVHRPSTRRPPTAEQCHADNRRMILEGFPIQVTGFDLEVLGPMLRQIFSNKRATKRTRRRQDAGGVG